MVKPLSLFSGALLAACMSLPAQADWYLDNESSRLSFISTKAGNLSEVHRFLTLHGRIDAKGAARLPPNRHLIDARTGQQIGAHLRLARLRIRGDQFEVDATALRIGGPQSALDRVVVHHVDGHDDRDAERDAEHRQQQPEAARCPVPADDEKPQRHRKVPR